VENCSGGRVEWHLANRFNSPEFSLIRASFLALDQRVSWRSRWPGMTEARMPGRMAPEAGLVSGTSHFIKFSSLVYNNLKHFLSSFRHVLYSVFY
jgi:hypothetical protein